MSVWRSRWAAIGAAVAVTLGGGGVSLVGATVDTGERPVTITVDPERILDTRTNLGLAGRFTSKAPRDLQVTGNVPVASGGSKTVVPADAVAALVNVTVVRPDSKGFLSLRPAGAAGAPTTSTVNFTGAGSVEPNAATVDLGPGGKIQLWLETVATAGTADVLVDVVGYTVDHTHDDRYYTKTQVDSRVSAVPTGHVKGGVVTQLGQHSTTSQTYVNVPGASVAVDTQAGGRLLVTFSTSVRCQDNAPEPYTAWCLVNVLVDGISIEPDPAFFATGDPGVNQWFSRSHQFVSAPLTAGPHTVQVRYRVDEPAAVFAIDQTILSALPLAP